MALLAPSSLQVQRTSDGRQKAGSARLAAAMAGRRSHLVQHAAAAQRPGCSRPAPAHCAAAGVAAAGSAAAAATAGTAAGSSSSYSSSATLKKV